MTARKQSTLVGAGMRQTPERVLWRICGRPERSATKWLVFVLKLAHEAEALSFSSSILRIEGVACE